MQQQELSIEAILPILNIEALNEMQEAALRATSAHNNVMIPLTNRLRQNTGSFTPPGHPGLLSKPFELYVFLWI